ncbi:MAG TPA: hypothetical protein PLV25_03980, partial [Opitutales bacterium]|nr:hypothetical protein [Opitutales bacterium]
QGEHGFAFPSMPDATATTLSIAMTLPGVGPTNDLGDPFEISLGKPMGHVLAQRNSSISAGLQAQIPQWLVGFEPIHPLDGSFQPVIGVKGGLLGLVTVEIQPSLDTSMVYAKIAVLGVPTTYYMQVNLNDNRVRLLPGIDSLPGTMASGLSRDS